MASLADMVRQNKMQSIPQDKLLGGLSSGLGGTALVGQYNKEKKMKEMR